MAPETSSPNSKRTALLGGLLAVLILVLVGELMWKNKSVSDEAPTPAAAPTPAPTASTPSAPAASAAAYKDGTYNADGTYQSPQGLDTIGVQLTISNGAITDVVVTPKAEGVSEKWQQNFAKNVKAVVVGKKIDDVKLDNVSGSSLCPKGFNEAVEKIKTQAKA